MNVLTISFQIILQEFKVWNKGKSPHSKWRNYDDFNEYFWAPFCFELGWPWRLNAGFFVKPKQDSNKIRNKFVSLFTRLLLTLGSLLT